MLERDKERLNDVIAHRKTLESELQALRETAAKVASKASEVVQRAIAVLIQARLDDAQIHGEVDERLKMEAERLQELKKQKQELQETVAKAEVCSPLVVGASA